MNVRENTDNMNIDMKKNNLKTKPFVKWAGGKYRLADELIPNVYKGFNSLNNTYFEPPIGFVGHSLIIQEMRRQSEQQLQEMLH